MGKPVSLDCFSDALKVLLNFLEYHGDRGWRLGRDQSHDGSPCGWHAHTDLPFMYYAYQEEMRDLLPQIPVAPGCASDFFQFWTAMENAAAYEPMSAWYYGPYYHARARFCAARSTKYY